MQCIMLWFMVNGFQWLYKSEKQIALFKKILVETIIKYKLRIHAVVLMRNHYYILMETLNANLNLIISLPKKWEILIKKYLNFQKIINQ